jgi:hypothetical protein
MSCSGARARIAVSTSPSRSAAGAAVTATESMPVDPRPQQARRQTRRERRFRIELRPSRSALGQNCDLVRLYSAWNTGLSAAMKAVYGAHRHTSIQAAMIGRSTSMRRMSSQRSAGQPSRVRPLPVQRGHDRPPHRGVDVIDVSPHRGLDGSVQLPLPGHPGVRAPGRGGRRGVRGKACRTGPSRPSSARSATGRLIGPTLGRPGAGDACCRAMSPVQPNRSHGRQGHPGQPDNWGDAPAAASIGSMHGPADWLA